ncbi:CAP domain-containing protein [Pendulispora albinea]|uniref:CAP domain-containing protein n=1 Tax=Pendulispora albinea TaxID=2741071 RepID=A0ABZ2M1R1_9BACT
MQHPRAPTAAPFVSAFFALSSVFVSACFQTTYTPAGRGAPRSYAAEFHEIVPPSAATYASEPAGPAAPTTPAPSPAPRTDTAGAGMTALADASFVRVFRQRGDTFRADPRLTQLASWIASRGEAPKDALAVDVMSRRLGYVGPAPWLLYIEGSSLSEADIEARLARVIESIPRNMPITRYGIGTAGAGAAESLAIAFASVEVELEPVPKHLARGQTLHLAGKVGDRFARVDLAITRPDGVVRTFRNGDRSYRGDLTLTDPGVHKVELLGDGATGPVVLANFPIYVDVDEPEPPKRFGAERASAEASAPLTPALAEQRMLALLARTREGARLPPLAEDDELAALARVHCEDMADHAFFGHVSPTTGTTEDRFRRANLLFPLYGENVARGSSPESAHEMLMDSPGHRANMINAEFTHVGIGAVVRPQPSGGRDVFVTLLFAKRPGGKRAP